MENNYENSYTLRQSGQQVQELLDYVEEHKENIGDRLKVAEVDDGASLATSTNVAGAMGWYINLASGTYTPIIKYEESGSYQDGQYVWQLVNDSPNIFKYPNLSESVHNPDFEFTFSLDTTEVSDYTKLELNDEVSWKADYSGNFFGTITSINGQGNQITVTLKDKDNVPTNFIPQIYCIAGGSIPEGKDRGYLWIPSKPSIGKLKIGAGAAAVGFNTVASEMGAFATGLDTLADGRYSTAEGRNTKASYAAHAEGYENEALGYYSHVEGRGNKTDRGYTHVQGKYADTSTKNYVDVIGWGSSSAPKNLETLDNSGNLHIKGNVYVSAADNGTGGSRLAKYFETPAIVTTSNTYAEVKAYIDAGRLVIAKHQNHFYNYSGISGDTYYFYYLGTGSSPVKYYLSINSNGVWSSPGTVNFLRLASSITGNPAFTIAQETMNPGVAAANKELPTSKAIANYLTTSRFEGGQVAFFQIGTDTVPNINAVGAFINYVSLFKTAYNNQKSVQVQLKHNSSFFILRAYANSKFYFQGGFMTDTNTDNWRAKTMVIDESTGTALFRDITSPNLNNYATKDELADYATFADLDGYTPLSIFISLDDTVRGEGTGLLSRMEIVESDISDLKADLEGVETSLADLHNGGTT